MSTSMHVLLNCTAIVSSKRAVFHKSTIKTVVISNTDFSSYQTVEPNNGVFNVDLDFKTDEVVTDHLKFHFFTGDATPVLIAAGAIDLGNLESIYKFTNNFQNVTVTLRVEGNPPDIRNCKRSALHDSPRIINTTVAYVRAIEEQMNKELVVDETNGGVMFSKLLALHNMDGEASSHLHYQQDFEPSQYTSDRFLLSGISMMGILETLRLQHLTVEDVMDMPDESRTFTCFVSMVCQACMRSAQLCPYCPDMNVSEVPNSDGTCKLVPGESFKRPFAEPFDGKAMHGIQNDDCEGEALWMLQLFASFSHIRDMESVFPPHLFNLTDSQKQRVYGLAKRIGNLINEGKLHCDVTLVSTGAAAFGQDVGAQIEGHATCVLSNTACEPHDILMEGTNCICPEIYTVSLQLAKSGGVKDVGISVIANALTRKMMGEENDNHRMMVHLDLSNNLPFYQHAFMQNNMLLAASGEQLRYGVHVKDIGDYKVKCFVPVSDEIMPGTASELANYFNSRRMEIHPPLAPVSKVIDATRQWSPMTLYEGDEHVKGRKFITCCYTEAVHDAADRDKVLLAKQAMCEKWNGVNGEVGHANAFVAFDSVYHCICLFSDDLSHLKLFLEKSP